MLFRKCGCLVAHGKYIFWKCFSIWLCVKCKIISVFILPSNLIFRKTERERERERVSPSPATTSLRLRRRPRAFAPWTHEPIFDFAGKPRAQITHEARAFDPRAFNFAGNSEPLTSPETHEPISLFVRFWFLCDFDFCCCCGGVLVVVGFVWVVMENNIFKMLPNTWKYFLEQFS